MDNALLVCRGEVRSPENSLLCVFGQANPAPTADDWIDWFSFDTLPREFQQALKPVFVESVIYSAAHSLAPCSFSLAVNAFAFSMLEASSSGVA